MFSTRSMHSCTRMLNLKTQKVPVHKFRSTYSVCYVLYAMVVLPLGLRICGQRVGVLRTVVQAGRSKALARWVLLQSLSSAHRRCPSAAIAISNNADVVKGCGFPDHRSKT